jgi:hypothetical protein
MMHAMHRLGFAVGLTILGLAAGVAPAVAAKQGACTNAAARKVLRADGVQLQKLRAGQYFAFRFRGGTWTFCDAKAGPARRFKSFNFDFNGQHNTGVRLLGRAGKCVALELRPGKGGYPSVPTVDMRRVVGAGGSASVHQIDFTAPGASITKVALSSTCLLGIAYRSVSGARAIQLNPITPPNVLQQTIQLSAQATGADLRSLKLKGDDVSWTDAGIRQSRHYSGRVVR